jgi:hypothetical protein
MQWGRWIPLAISIGIVGFWILVSILLRLSGWPLLICLFFASLAGLLAFLGARQRAAQGRVDQYLLWFTVIAAVVPTTVAALWFSPPAQMPMVETIEGRSEHLLYGEDRSAPRVGNMIPREQHTEALRKVRDATLQAALKPKTDMLSVVPHPNGVDIVLRLVEGSPRVIPTAPTGAAPLRLHRGESVYISASPTISGLEAGGDYNGDLQWKATPTSEFRTDGPLNYLVATVPYADLALRTTSALQAGTYVIHVRRAPWKLRPGEYAPGVPVAQGRLY